MKRKIYTILLLLPLLTHAQIKVSDKETYFDRMSKQVVVNMTVEAQKIEGTVALDFIIQDNQGHAQTLPAIIYASSARYYHVTRSSNTPWIYHTQKEPITVHYTARIAHESWMNHAQLAVNQVRYEKCGEWLVDTLTLINDLMVDPDPQVELAPEPQIWRPNPLLYARMVGFMTPEVEGIKRRAAMVRLNINYPVNGYKVIPSYMQNVRELVKVDSLMNALLKDPFIYINSYQITGYASPEGRYQANVTLAQNRSNGFRTYVTHLYQLNNRPITTEWVAEDWEGVSKAVNESQLDQKNAILHIINATANPDARDAKIKALDGSRTYNELLTSFYPSLRRIELRANYTVRSFSDSEAKELIYTRPELLSLDEMYRVALAYKPGSQAYREVYEIAAHYHPKDVIANNNAAAAILLEGDVNAAKAYLEKIKDDARSFINQGVIAYMEGDLESAKKYFNTAAQAGHEAGTLNVKLLENGNK